jgi:hypothetical protein
LKDWADNRWLKAHRSSPEEIAGLLSIVERDLRDAGARALSADWRFGIACNAALKLCTILLHVSGYRSEKTLQHYRTIQSLPLILGEERRDDAEYLETCRIKRNQAEYDVAGGVSNEEAEELSEFCRKFRAEVLEWLRSRNPGFVP